jgi:hypothetical protein
MSRAARFYRMLGFEIVHGGDDAAFTSFRAGTSFLNLIAQPAVRNWSWWGRVIFYHSDVDALYQRLIAAALLLQQSLLPTWEECPPNGGNHPEARSRARAFPRMPCM